MFLFLPRTQLANYLILWKIALLAVLYAPKQTISALNSGDNILDLIDISVPSFLISLWQLLLRFYHREYLKAPLIESAKVISSSTSSEKSDKPVLNINNNDEALIVYTSGTTGRLERF